MLRSRNAVQVFLTFRVCNHGRALRSLGEMRSNDYLRGSRVAYLAGLLDEKIVTAFAVMHAEIPLALPAGLVLA